MDEIWFAQNFFGYVTSWTYDTINNTSTIYFTDSVVQAFVDSNLSKINFPNMTNGTPISSGNGFFVLSGDIRNSTGAWQTLAVGNYQLTGYQKFFN